MSQVTKTIPSSGVKGCNRPRGACQFLGLDCGSIPNAQGTAAVSKCGFPSYADFKVSADGVR